MTIRISFFRIGNGHCSYVEFPNGERGLIDVNRKPENEGDDPLMLIWNAGIRRIHHLFITHPHRDHLTGFKALTDSFSIGHFYCSRVSFRPNPVYDDWEAYEQMRWNFLNRHPVGAGWYTQVGEVRVDYLLPRANLLINTNDDVNNNSLLMRFNYGLTKILLCGDSGQEAWVIVNDADIRSLDLLLASHHGNDSCYYQPKVAVMAPKHVIISAGPGTSHDADQKYRRYARNGVWSTRTTRVVAACDNRGNVSIS